MEEALKDEPDRKKDVGDMKIIPGVTPTPTLDMEAEDVASVAKPKGAPAPKPGAAAPSPKKARPKETKRKKTPLSSPKPKLPKRSKPVPTKAKASGGTNLLLWGGGAVGLVVVVLAVLALAGVFGGSRPEPEVPPELTEAQKRELAFDQAWTEAVKIREEAERRGTPGAWEEVLQEARSALAIKETPEAKELACLAKTHRDWLLAKEAKAAGKLEEALRLANASKAHGASPEGLAEYVEGLLAKKSRLDEETRRKKEYESCLSRAEAEEARGDEADLDAALSLWKQALENADSGEDQREAEARIEDLTVLIEFKKAVARARSAEAEGEFGEALRASKRALESKPDDPKAEALRERLEYKAGGFPALVVVLIASGIQDPGLGLGDPGEKDLPQIREKIRSGGFLVGRVKTMWSRKPAMWMGEFLTGVSFNGIGASEGTYRFKIQNLLELFALRSKAEPEGIWLIARDGFEPIDYAPSEGKAFTWVSGRMLKALEEGKQEGGPHAIRLVEAVRADGAGIPLDSDAFLTALGVRLLRNPEHTPRLAVFRLGGAGEADAKARLARDDKASARLWEAFQSNPYYARFGSFVVVAENGGAVLRGPAIREGAALKPAYLNQFLATFGKLLGYEPGEFLKASTGKPKDTPIQEAFGE